jgi:hypothetical protein
VSRLLFVDVKLHGDFDLALVVATNSNFTFEKIKTNSRAGRDKGPFPQS